MKMKNKLKISEKEVSVFETPIYERKKTITE